MSFQLKMPENDVMNTFRQKQIINKVPLMFLYVKALMQR